MNPLPKKQKFIIILIKKKSKGSSGCKLVMFVKKIVKIIRWIVKSGFKVNSILINKADYNKWERHYKYFFCIQTFVDVLAIYWFLTICVLLIMEAAVKVFFDKNH